MDKFSWDSNHFKIKIDASNRNLDYKTSICYNQTSLLNLLTIPTKISSFEFK